MSRIGCALVLLPCLLPFACGSTSTDDPVADASTDHAATEEPDARVSEDHSAAADTIVAMDSDARVVPDVANDVVTEEAPIDPSCIIEESSSLPGVRFAVQTTNCTFTLAEAAAGIAIPYDLMVDHDVPGFVTRTYFYMPDVANLLITERVEGNQQSYCVCDRGLPYPGCPDADGGFTEPTFGAVDDALPWYERPCEPLTIPHGVYHRVFQWDGRNWSGPSDTNRPKGLAFPVGDYELSISSNTGTLEGNDANARGAKVRVRIHLVP